jgi:UDP-2,3-diacylglucosamine pyrophosphatase LpxH
MKVREIEIAIISDLHLATYACKPKRVIRYLKSVQPKKLVLNGDIIDSWRFSRKYFPRNHLKVVRQIIKMMERGVEVIYITGNHDEFLRKISHVQIGNLSIQNQLVLDLNGKKTWIFHGDIFDPSIYKTPWLAKLGAAAYGLLTIINKGINHLLTFLGKPEIIIYKTIKERVLSEKLDLSRFETLVFDAANAQGYSTVICGHTHKPKTRKVEFQDKSLTYINCGDWLEHFTAVEYYNEDWHLYYHQDQDEELPPDELDFPIKKQLYQTLLKELAFANNIL